MKSLAKISPQTNKLPAVPASDTPDYENKISDVKYQNLVSQLNPHFLFNSLATLESLIYSDQRLAVKFLSQLTRVYRYILTTRNVPLVKLLEELNFIKDYADLLQTRFGKGLQIIINVPNKYHEKQIVPAVLQILVENATRHNITDPDSPLILTIHAVDNQLVIENNLQKKHILEPRREEALKSLSSLYTYFSDVPIEIHQTPEVFRVVIPLI
jgi:two-component system, LytTR family, sensor histidine kinase AlgZ